MVILRSRAVIVDEGKLLCVQHAHRDFFCLPGGKVEQGESPREAVIRELEEEIGICPQGQIVCLGTSLFQRDGKHNLDIYYRIDQVEQFRNVEHWQESSHAFELTQCVWKSWEALDDQPFKPTDLLQVVKQWEGGERKQVVFEG